MSYPFGRPFPERPADPELGQPPVDVRRLIFNLALFCVPSSLLFSAWPSHWCAWIIILFSFVYALITPSGMEDYARDDRLMFAKCYFYFLPATLAIVWLGTWFVGVWPIAVSVFLTLLCCGGYVWFLDSADVSRNTYPSTRAVPRGAILSSEPKARAKPHIARAASLRGRLATVQGRANTISQLNVFTGEEDDVVRAWQGRHVERIEKLLREGDQRTRVNWDKGIQEFNCCVGDVDAARTALRDRLAECKEILARFNIDYEKIVVSSGAVQGFMPLPPARKKFVTEKLNYAQGVGSGIAKVATGQAPWQVAAVVLVGMGIWELANRSKILRQLKEIEGKILENAAAASGDLTMFCNLLDTRLIPQLGGIADVVERLEIAQANLGENPDQENPEAREKALRLALAVVEGNRLMQMIGGN